MKDHEIFEEMISEYKSKFEKVAQRIKFALARNSTKELEELNKRAFKYKRQFKSWTNAYNAYKNIRRNTILALPIGLSQESINTVIDKVIPSHESVMEEVKDCTIDVSIVEQPVVKKEATDSYEKVSNSFNTIVVPKEFAKDQISKIQFKDNENIHNLVLLFIKSQPLNTRFSTQDISNLICTESSNRYDIMSVIRSFLSTLKRLGIIGGSSKIYIISQTYDSLRSLEREVNNARIKYGTNVVDKNHICNIIKNTLKVGEQFLSSELNSRIKNLNTHKRILDIYIGMYIRSFLKVCVKSNYMTYDEKTSVYTVTKDLADVETKIIIGDKEKGLIYNSLYSLLCRKEYTYINKYKSMNTTQIQNLVNSVRAFIKENKGDISYIKDKNILRVIRQYLKSQNIRLYKCKANGA